MEQWHKDRLENLTLGIINEFEYLKPKVAKNDSFYAVALITDEDVMTAFLAISSQNDYLKNANPYGYWGDRWSAVEWAIAIRSDDIKGGISDLYLPQMYKYFEEIIEPKDDDYEEDRNNFIELYTEALKCAKLKLIAKYGSEVENAIFFLDIPGDGEIAIKSAKIINGPSELLNQMLDDLD
ncbi:DUF4303 domain-containing protein [Acinetobacter piscicola]|uniref:DUF4303 domain-containing protein n=1 Tax=Acinetobacter piscicola TaxID=2006115 RepID=UPI0035564F15